MITECSQLGKSVDPSVIWPLTPSKAPFVPFIFTSPITAPTTSGSTLFAHWACFPVEVCASSPLCLSEMLFPWVSAWLTSPFSFLLSSEKHSTLPAPLPLAPEQLSQSTGLCLPHKAEAPWGQALAVLPWRFLGIQDWAWHRVVAHYPSTEHISLEKFSCWPWRESWLHVCVILGRSSGETSRSQIFSARLSLCCPSSARVSQTLVPPFLSLSSELLFWGTHDWAARSVAFPHLAAAISLSLGLTVI